MLVFRQVLLALNLLVAVVFVIDYLVVASKKAKPKTVAGLGVWLCVLFFAYLSLLLAYGVFGVVSGQGLRFLALLIYVPIPFVIGKLVSFRTLRFYAALQLLAVVSSLFALVALVISEQSLRAI